ncbi:MAG: hypothetical protein ABJC12_02770 [Saprospiraceae bacterium]
MKKFLIIITAVLFVNLTANGQNLFIIGEKSYPSTEAITLESNSDSGYELNVFIAKHSTEGLIGVSTKSVLGEEFSGKLIIYLEDGNVLICTKSDASEKVDDRAIALYKLSGDQLDKLKTSDINTVKYSKTWLSEQTYSASNNGIETSTLISDFFKIN